MSAEPVVLAQAPMVPEVRRVAAVHRETADTITVTLAGPDARPDGSPPWTRPAPGQFAMVSAFGVGEVPISYSAIGADGSVDHTIRAVGAVTDALCAVVPGDVVAVRGPFGRGWDLDAAVDRDVVVMAGGLGLAPLRPVVHAVLAEPDRFGSLSVLVGARTPAEVCFADELRRWGEQSGVHVAVTVDRVDPALGGGGWTGPIGVVTTLVPGAPFLPGGASAFVCGPEVMMRFGVRALTDRGVELGDIEVSGERSMTCGIGHCGHCQLGPVLLCRDGPVLDASRAFGLMEVKER